MKNVFVISLLVPTFLTACAQELDPSSDSLGIEPKSDAAPQESIIQPPKVTDSNQGEYTLIDEYCTLNCLFKTSNGSPLGIAVIKGYYSPVEREAWGTVKRCDSFTITGGSEDLSQSMVQLVDDGNTVHSKNELNQPVINLGLDLVNTSEQQEILNSTLNNQIELIVLRPSSEGRGASVCHAFLTVLRIK